MELAYFCFGLLLGFVFGVGIWFGDTRGPKEEENDSDKPKVDKKHSSDPPAGAVERKLAFTVPRTCVLFRNKIFGGGQYLKETLIRHSDAIMYAYWFDNIKEDMVILHAGGVVEGEGGNCHAITQWKPMDGWTKEELTAFENECLKLSLNNKTRRDQ